MEGGGSERQLLYLMKGLDRSRFDLRLYLLYRRGSLLDQVPEDISIESFWEQYRSTGWNWPGRIHRAQVAHLSSVIQRQQINLLYERLFHIALIAGPAVARSQRRGLKENVGRVSTIVSPPSRDVSRSERRWLFWKRHLLSQSYRSATTLLAVSQETAIDAMQYYRLNRKPIQVVASPIDISRIDEQSIAPIAPGETAERWRYRGNRRIVSVGRLSEEKGHRFLIEAVAQYQQRRDNRLPAVDLHLFGDGSCREQLTDLSHHLGIQEHVFFHGHTDNPYPFLQQCDLFVLPSLYEGLPNVVLEAMACRAPVLATDTEAGAGELLREHPLGHLAKVADSSSLAELIQNRFTHESDWLSRLDAARQFVRERHDLQHWIDRMNSIFTESLERNNK